MSCPTAYQEVNQPFSSLVDAYFYVFQLTIRFGGVVSTPMIKYEIQTTVT